MVKVGLKRRWNPLSKGNPNRPRTNAEVDYIEKGVAVMRITEADLRRLDKEGAAAAQVIVQARQGRNVVRVRIPPGIDSKKVEARIQKELPGRVKRINMRGETLVVHLRNVN